MLSHSSYYLVHECILTVYMLGTFPSGDFVGFLDIKGTLGVEGNVKGQ